MIIELFILQLAANGIRTRYNQEVQRQRTERQLGQLKMRLARLLDEYQSGAISAAQYKKLESDILKAIKNDNKTT